MWLFTRIAVWMAGGKAVRITPLKPLSGRSIDGLIVGGGADVSPDLYGQERLSHHLHLPQKDKGIIRFLLDIIIFPLTWIIRIIASRSNSSGVDPARDELERSLIDQCLKRRLPILGICRGEQLLNVHFGGTLHQRLTGFYTETTEIRTILPQKDITVEHGTRLYDIFGPIPCRVNALHRQGVHHLGNGIVVSARDRNGIIQAIEHEGDTWVLGVQWHPEFMPQAPRQRMLFRALVQQATSRMGSNDEISERGAISLE